jgi:hypothetical protein
MVLNSNCIYGKLETLTADNILGVQNILFPVDDFCFFSI